MRPGSAKAAGGKVRGAEATQHNSGASHKHHLDITDGNRGHQHCQFCVDSPASLPEKGSEMGCSVSSGKKLQSVRNVATNWWSSQTFGYDRADARKKLCSVNMKKPSARAVFSFETQIIHAQKGPWMQKKPSSENALFRCRQLVPERIFVIAMNVGKHSAVKVHQ